MLTDFFQKAYVVATAFDTILKMPKTVNSVKVETQSVEIFYMYRETGYQAPGGNDRINIFGYWGSQGAQVFSKVLLVAVERLSKNVKRDYISLINVQPKMLKIFEMPIIKGISMQM